MQVEKRIADEIEQKEGLLQDIEDPVDLKLMPMQHHKEVLINARDYGIAYGDNEIFRGLTFELRRGERVFLHGENGCGKSSLIKAVLGRNEEWHTVAAGTVKGAETEQTCRDQHLFLLSLGIFLHMLGKLHPL